MCRSCYFLYRNRSYYGTGTIRFSCGLRYLKDGINLIPAMIGLYGMSQVFIFLIDYNAKPIEVKRGKALVFKELWERNRLALKVAVTGFIIGIIPSVGANIASWVGYYHVISVTKHSEEIGKGSIDGLIGSQVANNACVPGTYALLATWYSRRWCHCCSPRYINSTRSANRAKFSPK